MSDTLSAAQVRWRCRRGMLELDVLLERFFDRSYMQLSQEEQVSFQKLLACTDQDLLNWLVNAQSPNEPELRAIIDKIIRNA